MPTWRSFKTEQYPYAYVHGAQRNRTSRTPVALYAALSFYTTASRHLNHLNLPAPRRQPQRGGSGLLPDGVPGGRA